LFVAFWKKSFAGGGSRIYSHESDERALFESILRTDEPKIYESRDKLGSVF
jgi:hypothetical protein